MDAPEDDNEEMSTSGVSTVNSTKIKPVTNDNKYISDEISKIKLQNCRLMQDLLESHKLYQALLKSTIEEQRLNLNLLRNFTTQLTNVATLYERSISQGYVRFNNFNSKTVQFIKVILFCSFTVTVVIQVI